MSDYGRYSTATRQFINDAYEVILQNVSFIKRKPHYKLRCRVIDGRLFWRIDNVAGLIAYWTDKSAEAVRAVKPWWMT